MSKEKHTLTKGEKDALMCGRSIPAIKLLRQRTGLGLREAKDIVDDYRLKHHLLTDTEKNKRKIEVHDQLVEALKKTVWILERHITEGTFDREDEEGEVVAEADEALEAAGEEV